MNLDIEGEGGTFFLTPYLCFLRLSVNFICRVHGIIQSPYPLPNDDEEIIRLDEQHYAFKFVFRRNVLAPISRKATNILDVGTGSGKSY